MIGHIIRRYRESRGLSLQAAGTTAGMSKDVLFRIEHGLQAPSAHHVRALAAALDAPELLVKFCETCPVHTSLLPHHIPELDNVSLHPAVVVAKGAEEAREAAVALDSLFKIFDRLDWADDAEQVGRVVELLEQVRDAEVAIRILYEVLFVRGLLPMRVLDEVQRRQHAKCVQRGYCKPRTGTEG